MALTPQFETVLANIYNQVDLDGNGTLSRTEFNLFNWRTSGEEVQDDEWQVVKDNFGMKNGELTMEGFLQLHQGRIFFVPHLNNFILFSNGLSRVLYSSYNLIM